MKNENQYQYNEKRENEIISEKAISNSETSISSERRKMKAMTGNNSEK